MRKICKTPHRAHELSPDPEQCCVTVLPIPFSEIPFKFAKYVTDQISVSKISYPDVTARSIVSESIKVGCQVLLQMANQSENKSICLGLSTIAIDAQSSQY